MILQGNSLDVLKTLDSESVDCCVTRDDKGRFIKGISYSPQTEFKKGKHWREKKPYWDKEWLIQEYIMNNKSAKAIAEEQGCHENNILYFLAKLKIPTKSMKNIRKNKHWGLSGKTNGMFGRIGKLNPNWDGGHTPERQSAYAKSAWKELAKSILLRDGYKCKICSAVHDTKNKLVVHHIKKWSRFPELRFVVSNLITLCEECHKNEHRKKGE